jgi:hypothetical protein
VDSIKDMIRKNAANAYAESLLEGDLLQEDLSEEVQLIRRQKYFARYMKEHK